MCDFLHNGYSSELGHRFFPGISEPSPMVHGSRFGFGGGSPLLTWTPQEKGCPGVVLDLFFQGEKLNRGVWKKSIHLYRPEPTTKTKLKKTRLSLIRLLADGFKYPP